MEEQIVKRGDIYYADFGDAPGSVLQGVRPVMIISNDVGNEKGPTVIAVAITASIKALHMPTHLILEREAGLPRKSMLLFEQMKTLDKTSLKGKVGRVSQGFLKRVDQALSVSVGLR